MVLPSIIENVVNSDSNNQVPHDTVIDEIQDLADKAGARGDELVIAIAVYMLGFSSYRGFQAVENIDDEHLKRLYEYATGISKLFS